MSDVIVAPNVRDLDTLALALTRWLRGKIPLASELAVTNLTYPRGAGRSHETILFDIEWIEGGAPRKRGCVVRIKPTRYQIFPDNLFNEQYAVIHALHTDGQVQVPRPLWMEPDPSILGAPFFVMEKVVGRVAVSFPPYAQTGWVADASPEQRRRLWQNGVTQLATMQRVPLDKLDFLAGPSGARSGLEQEFEKFTRSVVWNEEIKPWPVLRDALQRLKDLWPENRPEGMVWGDARIGNMIIGDDFQVLAVVDWEQPSLGGALNDLGWWLTLSELMHGAREGAQHLEGMGTRQETIDLWEKVSGKSAKDIEWYEDFTHLKMTCTGIRMAHLDNSPMPDESWLAKRLKVA